MSYRRAGYAVEGYPYNAPSRGARFHPRRWGFKTKIAVAVGMVGIIIAIIVGAVLGTRANQYPAYSKLNYTIKDICEWSLRGLFASFGLTPMSQIRESRSFRTLITSQDMIPAWALSSEIFLRPSLAVTTDHRSYVDAAGSSESELNLTYASSTSAILRVDTSETNATTGRKSARITSKNQYNDGLFIFDLTHAPFGCATWPAIWLSGPTATWPEDGCVHICRIRHFLTV